MSMQAVAKDRWAAPVVRAFAVLAVLLGLLVMHGIATAHHAQAAGPEQGAVVLQHGSQAPSHHGFEAPLVTAQAAAQVAPAGLPCLDGCSSGLVTLCLAIAVTAVALALGRSRGRPAGRGVVGRPAPVRVPGSARRTRPPPDPVRELCVSRT